MIHAMSLLFLALAVSLDGFGVGVMYGLRKIRIPFLSIAIISACSGFIIFGSMQIGVVMSQYVPPVYAKTAGALILIGIGAWALIQLARQKEESADTGLPADRMEDETVSETSTKLGLKDEEPAIKQLISIELRRLGLVIQILRTPSVADMDRSGNISSSEALLLGIALSLDAFGAGIGAALIGLTPVLTASAIAAASGTFLGIGLRVGFLYAELSWIRKLSLLPGCVLIIMGIMKLL
jgi:putative sporulation protein YtaF